jgi:hypothetical protein
MMIFLLIHFSAAALVTVWLINRRLKIYREWVENYKGLLCADEKFYNEATALYYYRHRYTPHAAAIETIKNYPYSLGL